MTDAVGHYAIYKPTLSERFWRRLGFRYRFDETLCDWRNAPMEGFVEGAITTTVAVHVGNADRFRLLVSGYCEVAVYTKTSVPVEHAVTRSEFAVLPPVPRQKAVKHAH